LNQFFLPKKIPNKFWIKIEIKICDRAKIQGKKIKHTKLCEKEKTLRKKEKV